MHICNTNARHAHTSATWAPQRNTRHVQKLGTQTQCKASSQDGCPNKKLIRNENVHTREHLAKRRAGGWIRTNFVLEVDLSIWPHPGWVPQCNERHVRKMGAQTQHKACPQVGRQRNARHVRKLCTPTYVCNANARHVCNVRHVGTSANWVPQRNARHVRNVRHVGTSANWAPQRNARHVRKMVAQTQNSSAMKTSTQGSPRLKDKLEDG
jgi:hypothetical protein